MSIIAHHQRDTTHRSAAFDGKARALNWQVFDQNYRIAPSQRHTISVVVVGDISHIIGPSLGLIIEIKLLRQISGPIMLGQSQQHPRRQNLYRRLLGPHGPRQSAPMVRVRCTGQLRHTGLIERH